MRARDYIVKRLSERGIDVTIAQDHDDLVILTDEEALEHNSYRFDVETRQRNRCLSRLSQIDRANLSEASRIKLDQKLLELGRRVSADRKARRELKPRPTPRATPLPPGAEPAREDVRT